MKGVTGEANRGDFDKTATAEIVTRGINLSGMTAVVTGCNSGIGYETMRVLALRGAYVIGTARTMEKAAAACNSIEGVTTPMMMELSDFASVAKCADEIQTMNCPIDILICNAGVFLSDLRQVKGIEMHFVVNHLGHFVFVNRLIERIKTASQGRIVIVGSEAHRSAVRGIEFDNLSGERGFKPMRAYGHSKLANGLFSRELAQRLQDSNVTSNCLHPGVVDTNIVQHHAGWQQMAFHFVGRWFLKSTEEGAATTCYVGTNPNLTGISGLYFDNCSPGSPSKHMLDNELANRLWEVSEGLTLDYLK